MKRSHWLAFMMASGLSLNVAAQTAATSAAPTPATPTPAAASAGPSRIAVISFEAAVGQTNEFQRKFGDLQKKYDPKRQELKALNGQIETLTKQLETQGDKLSDAERASRAKAIDDKKKQLQRSGEDAQNDFQQEMQEMFSSVASKVNEVLASYSQEHGYTLVLDRSQQQPVVLFAQPSSDITKDITQAYNAKSGVPAPPGQPAGSPDGKAPNGR
jgi:outer membrane protein